MIKFGLVAIMTFSMLMLSACGSVKLGHDFDVGLFSSKIEQGVTTQNQVRTWLGEPTSVGISVAADGERLDQWNYYFAEGKLHDLRTANVKLLQVKFNQQGIVRSYDWSVSKK